MCLRACLLASLFARSLPCCLPTLYQDATAAGRCLPSSVQHLRFPFVVGVCFYLKHPQACFHRTEVSDGVSPAHVSYLEMRLLVSTKQCSGSSIHELEEELRIIMDEDGSGIEVLGAREGLRAIKEAEVSFEKLAELGSEPLYGYLWKAEGMLGACVETVISNKLSLFPPLAVQKDWDLPGTHLPIGAMIKFGEASDLTVASWVVLDEWSGSRRLSCDLPCGSCSASIVRFRVIGQLRR